LVFQEEHESFHDITDEIIEDKEREITNLLKENRDIHDSLEANVVVSHFHHYQLITIFIMHIKVQNGMGAKCWLSISLETCHCYPSAKRKNKLEVDAQCILVFFFVI
jgi:hypothetical protein